VPETAVADAVQRQRALDISRSFIVQAPAGSGKTELLTQRYLRLLAEVAHPEEIQAITFTRKAAAEMRNRILSALDTASAPEPVEPHRRLTWSLARAALDQDASRDWQLKRNPNRLRIQTFDSLSHALARQMPLLSELGATPATTDKPEPHYQEAARATLRMLEDPKLGPDIEVLLAHLDNRQAQLEGLLCNMLARRDQWLGHALSSPHGDDIDRALEDAVTGHLQLLLQGCRPDWLHQLIVMAQHAAGNLSAAEQLAATPGSLAGWLHREQPPGTKWEDLPGWLGLTQLLLTKGGTLRKSWNADIGFPAPSEKGIPPELKTQRAEAKQTIKQLCTEIAGQTGIVELWVGLRLLPPCGLDEQQRSVLSSLFRVLLHAAAELRLVFQDSGEVDFSEIQMRALRALGSPDDPTDLALTLDYRLQHLLVDEFQDTSTGQYALLATLIAGWQAGDGRTLFAVGDPMQSIYRFREAEVGLYLAARDHGIGGLELTPLTLSVNFRSNAAIVDWANTSFATVFPARADAGRGAVPYSPASAYDQSPDHAAVRVHPFAGVDPKAEALQVVVLVREALAETESGQVAVLARARSHLHEIALALGADGIAFQAVDVDPLARRPVVQDLHALTRALLHPADRLAWLVVLRAPWLGLSIQDLLLIAESTPRCIFARLRDPQLRATLSEDGRRRVERLLPIIEGQLPARGRRPLRQWVESIWLMLGGRAIAGSSGDTDAQAYLRLLDQHEQAAGLLDFARLQASLEKLYAAPDSGADGRVQLMTMHKSKGLEFDTVILPGLGRKPASDGSELLYWLERTGSEGHTQLLMAPIRAAEQQAEPISDYLRELNKDKNRLETSRLLYVAATRARRRLHLLGHIGFNAKGVAGKPLAASLLEKLWPVVKDDFADLSAPPAVAADETMVSLAQLSRLPADWQPRLTGDLAAVNEPIETAQPEPRIEFVWAGDTARHVGTLVHRQLERIARDGIANWSPARIDGLEGTLRRGLHNLGVDSGELDRAVAKAQRALRQTLADENGRWILAPHREAQCEWPLTLHEETSLHYVIDRTFVDENGVRWIIDYKTGEHLEGDRAAFLDQEQARYREQLETYGRIVRLLEDRPICLALYFPLFPDWRVWDYKDGVPTE
jgi:ATP-dependent exoDNAse (exonuclease V) beta subunit